MVPGKVVMFLFMFVSSWGLRLGRKGRRLLSAPTLTGTSADTTSYPVLTELRVIWTKGNLTGY